MQKIRSVALTFVFALVSFCCAPRSISADPPQQPAGPSQDSVLRAHSNLVLLDVVVTDHETPVHGLTRSQFHIFDNGREQSIQTFDEHQPPSQPPSVPAPFELPPHTFTNIPLYPTASAVNVLLLDGLNTALSSQLDVRRQMLLEMGEIAPGTPLIVFTLSSRLRMLAGFTTDPASLVNVLKKLSNGPGQSALYDTSADKALDSAIGDMINMGMTDKDAIASIRQFQVDTHAYQTDQRVRMTLHAFQVLARYLSAIPGRKNLIWFSGSFPIKLDPDDSQQSPFEAMRNYSDELRETSELLASARVAVYPVEAHGGFSTFPVSDVTHDLSTNPVDATVDGGSAGGRSRTAANRQAAQNDQVKYMDQLMAEQATLQQIAQETGGKAYINTNGLKEAVASAVENGSGYYTIGYIPPAHSLDGTFHKIKIKVGKVDCRLAYRNGYYADSPDHPSTRNADPASLIMAVALHGAPPATQILFRARVLSPNDPLFKGSPLPTGPLGEMTAMLKPPTRRAIVDLTVDPRDFAYDITPDGLHQAKIEFVLIAYNPVGARVNYVDRGFQASLTPQQYASALAHGIPTRLALDLPNEPVSLRIAVHDLAADRAGSLEIPFPLPPIGASR